jgi:chorismate-pyruvate lyase
MMLRIAISLAAPLLLASSAMAQADPRHWSDTPVSRLEALALLQSLNAELLSHDSATLVLESWCGKHHLASPAHIVAERDKTVRKEPTPEQLQRLGVKAGETVGYRNVKLLCGDHVLSEADNWYVPDRLTPDMNKALDTTDVAFGRAVAPLHFQRHTLSADLLWSPLPEGWETAATIAAGGPGALRIPDHVLQHHAILTRGDGTPFSEVVETYTGAVLDFMPPQSQ